MTTKTVGGRNLLQSDRNAGLLVDVLRRCVAQKRFSVLDFVIMPNHLHLLIALDATMTVEKAMQFVKGAFSFRLRSEFGYRGEIWQRGFSDARVHTAEAVAKCRQYIAQNPVRAGLADTDGNFPWCFASVWREKLAGAKAHFLTGPERHD